MDQQEVCLLNFHQQIMVISLQNNVRKCCTKRHEQALRIVKNKRKEVTILQPIFYIVYRKKFLPKRTIVQQFGGLSMLTIGLLLKNNGRKPSILSRFVNLSIYFCLIIELTFTRLLFLRIKYISAMYHRKILTDLCPFLPTLRKHFVLICISNQNY